jgi:hypothetical protein
MKDRVFIIHSHRIEFEEHFLLTFLLLHYILHDSQVILCVTRIFRYDPGILREMIPRSRKT